MIKLQHHLARFIVPVFLLQALSLQAETSSESSSAVAPTPTTPLSSTPTPTVMPPIPLPTVDCDSLSDQTMGVQQRLNQHSGLVSERQCIVLSANPSEDLSELIKQIPENTVILLSSDIVPVTSSPSIDMDMTSTEMAEPTTTAVMPSPTVTPAPGRTPAEYFIGSEMLLKDGQDILGAADEGFEIIIRDRPGFEDRHMVKVGTTNSFQSGETKDSNIRHITFQPTRDNNRRSIDSIVFAECYNRTLIVEKNIFHLDTRAAVFLDCKETLDVSADNMKGPGLQFANNMVIGETFSTVNNNFIPDEGLFINLPAIKNQFQELAVIGNTFQGSMAEAGEFILGAGTSMDVFRNTVDISNTGNTRRDSVAARKGGFVLIGTTDTAADRPLFNLAGNQIQVTRTAITVRAQLELALACNHLQAVTPWRQPQQQFSLKASDPTLLEDECEEFVSSTIVMPTPTPGANSRIFNSWTAINGSTATACNGLVNLEGQFFFDSEVCLPVTPPSASSTSAVATTSSASSTTLTSLFTATPTPESTAVTPTSTSTPSSAATTVVTTALGVLATLAILLVL